MILITTPPYRMETIIISINHMVVEVVSVNQAAIDHKSDKKINIKVIRFLNNLE